MFAVDFDPEAGPNLKESTFLIHQATIFSANASLSR
jgi:hypothetical protein